MGRVMINLGENYHCGSHKDTRYPETELDDLMNPKTALLRSGSTFRCWLEGKNPGPKEQDSKRLQGWVECKESKARYCVRLREYKNPCINGNCEQGYLKPCSLQ